MTNLLWRARLLGVLVVVLTISIVNGSISRNDYLTIPLKLPEAPAENQNPLDTLLHVKGTKLTEGWKKEVLTALDRSDRYDHYIHEAYIFVHYEVEQDFIHAIAMAESHMLDTQRKNEFGACGPMQVTPIAHKEASKHWPELKALDRCSIENNFKIGAAHLWYLRIMKGITDPLHLAIAYNSGEKAERSLTHKYGQRVSFAHQHLIKHRG